MTLHVYNRLIFLNKEDKMHVFIHLFYLLICAHEGAFKIWMYKLNHSSQCSFLCSLIFSPSLFLPSIPLFLSTLLLSPMYKWFLIPTNTERLHRSGPATIHTHTQTHTPSAGCKNAFLLMPFRTWDADSHTQPIQARNVRLTCSPQCRMLYEHVMQTAQQPANTGSQGQSGDWFSTAEGQVHVQTLQISLFNIFPHVWRVCQISLCCQQFNIH